MELRINNLQKKFDDKVIFNDANFTFETGKIYGLLGRNGSGKTTLFNCLARNIPIDSGQILINEDADYDNTEIGFAYTQPNLPEFMTGFEFVQFTMDVNFERIKEIKTASEYLNEIGIIEEDQHKLLKDYSHGMRNKVQMLVSMMMSPTVLLLDEPLTSFDVVAAHEMKEMIVSAKKESIIIFSTHILPLAQDLCDEIVLLSDKKLTSIDSKLIHDEDFEQEVIQLLTEEKRKDNV